MLIFASKNFELHSHEQPEVGREDGGHLVIHPKVKVEDRTKLSAELVKELALVTNIAGYGMREGMLARGIELGRINYQDNGNWKPELHVHLYGRALNAKFHPYGEPIKAARILSEKIVQEPLNSEDVSIIREYCLKFSQSEGYTELDLK